MLAGHPFVPNSSHGGPSSSSMHSSARNLTNLWTPRHSSRLNYLQWGQGQAAAGVTVWGSYSGCSPCFAFTGSPHGCRFMSHLPSIYLTSQLKINTS